MFVKTATVRTFTSSSIIRAAAKQKKGPIKSKTPASKKSAGAGGGGGGVNDTRNQIVKQILYEGEHEINSEQRKLSALEKARQKKRLSPVEYARNPNNIAQVAREERDYIERMYSLYKQDEFKRDFDTLTRQSLAMVSALEELQKLDKNLFVKCFSRISPPPPPSSEAPTSTPSSSDAKAAALAAGPSANGSNQQVALSHDSAPLPLFPRRMRIPAETLPSPQFWDYEMLPPSSN